MVLCTHMSVNPVNEDTPAVTLSPNDRKLSPIDGRVIDIHLSFSRPLSENLICHFIAVVDVVLSFNVNGDPILS